MKKRRKFTSKFKFQVILEIISKERTITEIATKYELHPVMMTKWKSEFLRKAPDMFSDRGEKKDKEKDKEKDELIEELYKQIGQSKVEVDWLKKKIGLFSSS